MPRAPKERPSEDWRVFAACAGADLSMFFPDDPNFFVENVDGNPGKLCSQCTVKTDCLNYAVTLEIRDGVFGGTNEMQRLRLINAKINARRTESRERRKNKSL